MKGRGLWATWLQTVAVCAGVIGLGLLISGSAKTMQAQETTVQEYNEMVQAYSFYKQKCLSCHYDVTDPEKPGKTRDQWRSVVNTMRGHGVNVNLQEAGIIVDLLYLVRPGD